MKKIKKLLFMQLFSILLLLLTALCPVASWAQNVQLGAGVKVGGGGNVSLTAPSDFSVSGSPGASLGISRVAPVTVSVAANCASTSVAIGGTYVWTGATGTCTFTLPAIGVTPNQTDPTCFMDRSGEAYGYGAQILTQSSNTIEGSAPNATFNIASQQNACFVQDSTTDYRIVSYPRSAYYNYGISNNAFSAAQTITSIAFSTPTVTVTVGGTYFAGQWVLLAGAGSDNGFWQVSATGSGTFSFTDSGGAVCASSCGTAQSQDIAVGATGNPTLIMTGTVPPSGKTLSPGTTFVGDFGSRGRVVLYNMTGSPVNAIVSISLKGLTYSSPACSNEGTVPANGLLSLNIDCEAFATAGTVPTAELYDDIYVQASATGVWAKFGPQTNTTFAYNPLTAGGRPTWETFLNIIVNGP